MDKNERAAIQRVLREATRVPHFFDLNEGERISFLIARAYRMGIRDAAHRARRKRPEVSDERKSGKSCRRPRLDA